MLKEIKYLTEQEYKTLGFGDYPDLEVYIDRANLDMYRLIDVDMDEFEELSDRERFKVKMATADQVVFLASHGIESTIGGGSAAMVRIGNYSEGSSASEKAVKSTGYASTVFEWLRGTGLLSLHAKMENGSWWGA